MFLRLYKALNILFTPIIFLILLYRVFNEKEDSRRIKERFGIASCKRGKKKIIWIHVASVGEMFSVSKLLDALSKQKQFSILLTSGTVTSAGLFVSRYKKSGIIHQYVPVENYFAIKKFLHYWNPDLAIFLESEFWPCVLSETAKSCKIISLNTRLSERSFARWSKIRFIFKEIIESFAIFLPQSIDDYKRLKKLGVHNVKYLGNIKYTVPSLDVNKQELEHLNKLFLRRKVALFVSTHPGEEEKILKIYEVLKDKFKDLLFIIAPRHIVRTKKILDLLKESGYKYLSSSEILNYEFSKPDFLVVDTMGNLGSVMCFSKIAVMCGSFVNIGGHNPIEAAKLKSAIVVGPYISKQKELYGEFVKSKSAICVNNEKSCAQAIYALLSSNVTQRKYIANATSLLDSKKHIFPETLKIIEGFLR